MKSRNPQRETRDFSGLSHQQVQALQAVPTKKGQKVFVSLPDKQQLYGATLLYMGRKHCRVRSYTGALAPHNVPKEAVTLQDGEYNYFDV